MMYGMFKIFAVNLAMVAAQTGVVLSSSQELTFGVHSETVAGCVLCGQPGACCCSGTYSRVGSTIVVSSDSLYPPEGSESLTAQIDVLAGGWVGWFVQWGAQWDEHVVTDMRQYVHGCLRFWVKTPVDLIVGIRSDNVMPGYERSRLRISEYCAIDGQWHEVSIPILDFVAEDSRLDLGRMKILFNVACVEGPTGSLSFGVDNVRWSTDDESVLHIGRVAPDRALNVGSVVDTVHGWGFESGTAVTLMHNGNVITGTNTAWISSEVLIIRFDVLGSEEADWDVIVSNPGGASDTLQDGFAVRFLKPPSVGPVSTAGRQIFVDGSLYTIKGVGYAPTPIGEYPGWLFPEHGSPDTVIYHRDFSLLRQMGCNTIRTWGQVSRALLDQAHAYGLKVICGFWVDTHLDLTQSSITDSMISNFRSYVQRFMDSPAVLMWSVGNEQNYQNGNNRQWYRLVNDMAHAAYQEEGPAYHAVTTPNGDIHNIGDLSMQADDVSMNYLDVWGANVYRGISFGSLFDDLARESGKPFWVSEYGIDAWDHGLGREYQETQADWVMALWGEMEQNAERCSGGTIMAYCDEWWKNGNADSHDPGGYQTPYHPDGWSDEEYYGIMSVADDGAGPDIMSPRQVYSKLREIWIVHIVRGDVDEDGMITVLDVVAAINHILGFAPLTGEPFLAADCDADGQVTVLDALGIVNVILGTGACSPAIGQGRD